MEGQTRADRTQAREPYRRFNYPEAVVDERLLITSGSTNAPTIMIAEKAEDMIRANAGHGRNASWWRRSPDPAAVPFATAPVAAGWRMASRGRRVRLLDPRPQPASASIGSR